MSNKKVVLITGCSDGGLGSALAIAFYKAGYRVIATARNLSKLTETRKLGIEEIQLDVLSDTSLSEAAKKLDTLTGNRLDILVNNAGEGYNMPAVDSDLSKVRKVFELNVFSVITVTHAFLPSLVATPDAKVVNNISVAGRINLPFQGTYNASKAAAMSYTENLRLELAPFDIRVISLMTGGVKTNFFNNVEKNYGQGANALPHDSIYRVVPSGIKLMKDPEGSINADGVENADYWAKNVVADLSKAKPPHQIWRGSNAGRLRWLVHLPVGMMDGALKGISGLDEVEKAVKRK
ncbi:NADPH-dependent 1-acyl dihydroxyacetone phosphate reductase [Neophaeococcomyces mojaviensis]|uniref:NADPH-dependent 1-acyl dihydroxyacetone phosphate reductase n=1 Tax=Neophaeococcomyces mojaviensis TaxID=3383035 RepID=A0ACC3AEQ2_9EURO|nr:NADPH-dependent 1-acyl dihydroxyacetone phosphate reductase [Knufia sp. JES_112]